MGQFIQGFPQLPDTTLDPKIYSALVNIHLAINNLDQNVGLQTGVQSYTQGEWPSVGGGSYLVNNATRIYVKAGAAITAGQAVNLFYTGGDIKARPAIATAAGTFANGIATSSASTVDTFVEVQYMHGSTTLIGGLTPGAIYYLSDITAGLISSAKPTVAGHIVQPIGFAINASLLLMDISLNFTQL